MRFGTSVAVLTWLALAGSAQAQIEATTPGFLDADQRALTAGERAVIDAAIEAWETIHPGVGPITVEFSFDSGIGGLAVTDQFTDDQIGQPVSAAIRFRDAEPGLFWVDPAPGFSPPDAVPFGFFDLFTIALHEIGHAIGFTVSYSDFATHVGPSEPPDNYRPYACTRPPQIRATLLPPSGGTHTAFDFHPQDLMNAGLSGAQRKLVSPIDALMIDCAFRYGIYERVPALSPWGSAALALILLGAGPVLLRKGRL